MRLLGNIAQNGASARPGVSRVPDLFGARAGPFALLSAVLLLAVSLSAQQMKLTIRQLTQFLRSSVELRHDDKKVADYLKGVKLTQKLDDATIVSLQAAGVGPKTLQRLQELKAESRDLPSAAPEAAPAKPVTTIEPPRAEEQNKVLEAARDYAMNYVRRLPDFLCTQVTRRYEDPSGLEFWQQVDVITAKLTYFEQKENYQVVLVNNFPTEVGMERLGGFTSSGEFGSLMKELFDPATKAEFEWTRWATLRGRRVHVYSFRVPKATSKLTIGYHDTLRILTGYQGLVYIDRDTYAVARIRQVPEDIPASFPLQQVSRELDYDLVAIGESMHMLPLKFTTRMREGRSLSKNDVEFRMYRKFGADATIKFDTPDPLSEEQTKEQPPKE
jgi:hypothetical protein